MYAGGGGQIRLSFDTSQQLDQSGLQGHDTGRGSSELGRNRVPTNKSLLAETGFQPITSSFFFMNDLPNPQLNFPM